MTSKILIADDTPANKERFTAIFADSDLEIGFTTYDALLTEATSPALQASANFDALIAGRGNDEAHDIDFLKRIKRIDRLAHLPVILLWSDKQDKIGDALLAGAYFVFSGSFCDAALRSVVEAALLHTRQWNEKRQRLADSRKAWLLLQEGSFSFRTIDEAQGLASFIATAFTQAGSADAVALGLSELLINAVEHGNLGISYQEKSLLRRNEGWIEEVERRAALPENLQKRVRVHFSRQADFLKLRIVDEGPGFPWQDYIDFCPERANDPNGRGIALARLGSFATLEYLNNGNTVEVSIDLPLSNISTGT